jgi:hypothetical protein
MMHTHLLKTKTSTRGTSSRKGPSERYPVSCSSQDDCPTFRSQETLRKSKNAVLRGVLYTPLPQRGSLEEQTPTWRPSQKTDAKYMCGFHFALSWELLSRATSGMLPGLHRAKRGEKTGNRILET